VVAFALAGTLFFAAESNCQFSSHLDSAEKKKESYLMIVPLFTRFFIIAVVAISLSSCADTEFYNYSGAKVFTGTGGASRSIDGIDFWIEGTPAQKYEIIGVITDNRRGSILQMALRNGAIASLAKAHGGNAVMLADDDREVVGSISNGSSYTTGQATITPYPSYVSVVGSAQTTGTGMTALRTRRNAKYYVIRYL
jgi:hypothetical protein